VTAKPLSVGDVGQDFVACCDALQTAAAHYLFLCCAQVDGQNVAVEVDGSHHYTNSLPHMPLSEVVVRRRMLQVGQHKAGHMVSFHMCMKAHRQGGGRDIAATCATAARVGLPETLTLCWGRVEV